MTRPAVFLDRDGTLVEDVAYLHDPERLVLLPGVGELAALAAAGYALVVVTCTTRRP
jgi:D-glycero-D-manno-heptose 1,7-bisphosphate phosphatase